MKERTRAGDEPGPRARGGAAHRGKYDAVTLRRSQRRARGRAVLGFGTSRAQDPRLAVAPRDERRHQPRADRLPLRTGPHLYRVELAGLVMRALVPMPALQALNQSLAVPRRGDLELLCEPLQVTVRPVLARPEERRVQAHIGWHAVHPAPPSERVMSERGIGWHAVHPVPPSERRAGRDQRSR